MKIHSFNKYLERILSQVFFQLPSKGQWLRCNPCPQRTWSQKGLGQEMPISPWVVHTFLQWGNNTSSFILYTFPQKSCLSVPNKTRNQEALESNHWQVLFTFSHSTGNVTSRQLTKPLKPETKSRLCIYVE